jgi:excisionase family DNA binding protein
MSKETFTTREAAEELGVSSARVRQMILEGHLPAEKFGHVLVIRAAALDAARHRKTSPGPAPKANSTEKPARKSSRKKAEAKP